MKYKNRNTDVKPLSTLKTRLLGCLLAALALLGGLHQAAAQNSNGIVLVTYQGKLNFNGQPAPDGDYYCICWPYWWWCPCPNPPDPPCLPCGINNIWQPGYPTNDYSFGPILTNNIQVQGGLFNMQLPLNSDFLALNSGSLAGQLYFQLYVGSNAQSLQPLSPAQPVTATPFAAVANTLSGPLPASSLSGTLSSTQLQGVYGNAVVLNNPSNVLAGDGSQLANVNATTVGGQTAASILNGVSVVNAATSANVAGAIVARDTNGNFSAGSINLSGSLNVPFPFIMYEGTNTLMIEEGSLFWGINSGSGTFQNGGLSDVGFGDYVMSSSGLSGSFNTGMGEYALADDQTGSNNTAIGYQSLNDNSNGNNNVAVGFQAFQNSVKDSNVVAVGYQALQNANYNATRTNSSETTAVGFEALQRVLGGKGNTALGYQAGSSFTGNESYNIDIGNGGTTGDNNTIRIGSPQANTYIAGIFGGTLTGAYGVPMAVFVDDSGHLGTTVPDNTYIPTIGDGTHNFTTYTQSGYYSQVGNLVYFEIWLRWNAGTGSATGSDNLEILLPLPVASQRVSFPVGFTVGINFSTNQLAAGANNGASYLLLYKLSNTGANPSNVTVNNCGTSGEIQISGTYRWQ